MISKAMVQVRCDGVVESGRPLEGKMQCQAGEVVALESFADEASMLLRLHRELVGWAIYADRRALCPVCAGRAELERQQARKGVA